MNQCMLEKLGMPKAPYGYFTQLRIHDTERPKPKSFATEFMNRNAGMTPEFREERKKLGSQIPYTGNL